MIDYKVEAARRQEKLDGNTFHTYVFEDGTVWTEFYRTPNGYLLRFPELADFEVSATGEKVVAFPTEDADAITIEHLYINQLIPLALSRQGHPAYHASVVTVPGGAVAFIGESGMGKSTLAASFALSGSKFLTDDALLIEERESGCMAMPSHSSIRLWEDSVDALIDDRTSAAEAISYSTKIRLLAGSGLPYDKEPQPLLAAYVLQREDVSNVAIAKLGGLDRYMAWLSNSFLLDIEDQDLLSQHFEWTHRISGAVPTFSLDFPRAYGMLPEVRKSIQAHVASHEN